LDEDKEFTSVLKESSRTRTKSDNEVIRTAWYDREKLVHSRTVLVVRAPIVAVSYLWP